MKILYIPPDAYILVRGLLEATRCDCPNVDAHLPALTEAVRRKMEEGYSPVGAATIGPGGAMVQAMIRIQDGDDGSGG